MHGLVDSLYVKELAHKTHRALTGLALKGYSTGGRCYGYRSVQTPDGVLWEVDETQAVIIRRIFEMAAAGISLKKIAKMLNAEQVPPPRPRKGRIPSWCANGVRAMLRNETYVGVKIWNREKFVRGRSKKRVARPRPENEWKRVESPALRIIDHELWEKVQQVLAWKTEHYSRGGGVVGRVSNHMLTGILHCSECGGLLTIVSGYHKGRNAKYGCANYANRGTCGNDLRVSEAQLQEQLLTHLQELVISEVDFAVEEYARQVQIELSDVTTRLAADRQRKAKLDAELGRLWAAFAAGGGEFESLRGEIAQRDEELRQINGRLLAPRPESLDLAKIKKLVMKELNDLPSLMNDDVPAARTWLARRASTITMTPAGAGKTRYYAVDGTWNLGTMSDWGGCGGWI